MIPVIALGGARHCYFAHAAAGGHARFRLVAVADAASTPDWSLARARRLAAELQVPFEDDIDAAISRYRPQAACVSPATSRHAELTEIACAAGLHVIQDKPMAHTLEDCTRIVRAVRRAGTRFLLWNRNGAPAIRQARDLLERGALGALRAIHVDFYFAKDAGPRIGEGRPVPPDPGWEPLGELSVEGIYPLAYIAHLARSPVATVFARATSHFHRRHRDHGIEDLASLRPAPAGRRPRFGQPGQNRPGQPPGPGRDRAAPDRQRRQRRDRRTAAGSGGLPPWRGAGRVSAPAGRRGGRALPAG